MATPTPGRTLGPADLLHQVVIGQVQVAAGRVVYTRRRGRESDARGVPTAVTELWTVPLGGGDPVRLTSPEGHDHGPRISADGTRLAFTTGPDNQEDILVKDLTSSQPPAPLPGGFGTTASDDAGLTEEGLGEAEGGHAYGDEAIADAVRRELREDAATTDLQIRVAVRNGVVHLHGTVPGLEDADAAEEVASRVTGVREVVEGLDVAAEG